jgi:hypothetical protein
MRRYIALMTVLIGCSSSGVSSSTLQGAGSFISNSVFAERFPLPDGGGILQDYAVITIEQTSPVETCAFLKAPPDSGLAFAGQVTILIDNNNPIEAGNYDIVDQESFNAEENHPDGGIALVELLLPTDPPSAQGFFETSLSGNLKLTSAGSEWAGTFSTVLTLFDGGQAQLSGTFDTTSTCVATQ